MTQQTGTFQTLHASKYLQQMCKHFAHKVDVTYSETRGDAVMPFGAASFDATADLLTVSLKVETDAQLEQARHVIDIHLKKFAFRENFETHALDGSVTGRHSHECLLIRAQRGLSQSISGSALIPGVGLWNHLDIERVFVGAHLTRQAGQPQKRIDDASLAGGRTGPDNDTELWATKKRCGRTASI